MIAPFVRYEHPHGIFFISLTQDDVTITMDEL